LLLLHNVDPAWQPEETASALDGVEQLADALRQEGHPVVTVCLKNADLPAALRPFGTDSHIVFNWCEELPGMPRSEAHVVKILESMNFVYTGSTPEVLTLSWDKSAVKRLLQRSGIPTPRWRLYFSAEKDDWQSFPAIVKPAFEHCSIGITTEAVVLNPVELRERILFVQKVFHQPALVEDFIDGREFHVTLWGNGRVSMLPPAEMDFSSFDNVCDRLCTFDSKFSPGSVHFEKIELRIPALLDGPLYERLRETSVQAYRVLGCRDYARIDLRLRDGIFYVLDINPNADFSPDTSMVYAAETVGLTYGALGSHLANLAAQRHPLFCGEVGIGTFWSHP